MKSVYLIGDSITMNAPGKGAGGYGSRVADMLAGEAHVSLVPENGHDSRNVIAKCNAWMGNRHFDVIHINCGLHDVKRSRTTHALNVPANEYERNLQQIVRQLRQHAHTLIWATTTPVIDGFIPPEKPFDMLMADVQRHNAVACRVMREMDVRVNDLHDVILNTGLHECLWEDGVHMTSYGMHALAEAVTGAIRTSVIEVMPSR